jgi:metal-responsive CopG/Arc/MetJ family transcriptional regulator
MLLKFSTIKEVAMPTVNFSVPEEVKDAFNATFEGQNKSAVIADLMREAVERAQRREQHRSAVGRILANRASGARVTEAQFRSAREEGRP